MPKNRQLTHLSCCDKSYTLTSRCQAIHSSVKCSKLVAKQSCNGRVASLCIRHWTDYCKEKQWDPDLSTCANMLADSYKLSLEQRGEINQYNIEVYLSLSGCYDQHHLSNKRRKMYYVKGKKPKTFDMQLGLTYRVNNTNNEYDSDFHDENMHDDYNLMRYSNGDDDGNDEEADEIEIFE